jgi:hypothetical protein
MFRHEAALASSKLTRVLPRGAAYPSEVIMSRKVGCLWFDAYVFG